MKPTIGAKREALAGLDKILKWELHRHSPEATTEDVIEFAKGYATGLMIARIIDKPEYVEVLRKIGAFRQ